MEKANKRALEKTNKRALEKANKRALKKANKRVATKPLRNSKQARASAAARQDQAQNDADQEAARHHRMKRERTAERAVAQQEAEQAIACADAAKAAAAKATEGKVRVHNIRQELNVDIKCPQRLRQQPRRKDSCYKHHLRVLLQLKSYTKKISRKHIETTNQQPKRKQSRPKIQTSACC